VVNTLTHDEWLALLAQHEERCAYCGAPYESIDHVVPLSRGGANVADNVVPACLSCNGSKQDSAVA
jgi:5-methylcytosine-specific restriction endonuclease McrA